MDEKDINTKLFRDSSEDDTYIEHLLEQYKLYINSHEKVSDRRQKTNEFFLGLNTALLAALGFIVGKFGDSSALLVSFALVAGMVICYFWYRIIYSYKGLNTGKFKVIHAIESRLPLSLYDTEWDVLGRGEDKEKYWPFSHIEIKIPWVFILLYGIILAAQIYGLI
ncbi:hypothetical protein CL654_00265 [bacterium]|nr:hypothetical protein [bacterium]|tara:strand:- start:1549 stop:2046 length:498 start_codon:yes stop_codon:yes gene_type:complete